jgi:hypothetical protein
MKFEIFTDKEEYALEIYDQIATCMKVYGWKENIVLFSDMTDMHDPDKIRYWVRVGDWAPVFTAAGPVLELGQGFAQH